MDIFTQEKRSEIMSAVKGKDTKPEVMLRKALFSKGLRYSFHTKSIEGKPDIYLKKYNAVIFFTAAFGTDIIAKQEHHRKQERNFGNLK